MGQICCTSDRLKEVPQIHYQTLHTPPYTAAPPSHCSLTANCSSTPHCSPTSHCSPTLPLQPMMHSLHVFYPEGPATAAKRQATHSASMHRTWPSSPHLQGHSWLAVGVDTAWLQWEVHSTLMYVYTHIRTLHVMAPFLPVQTAHTAQATPSLHTPTQ